MALSEKKRKYAEARLNGKTQRESARLSGSKALSDGALSVSADKLEKDPEVQAYIRAEQERLSKKSGINREKWLMELAAVGFANIASFAKWGDGAMVLTPSSQMSVEDLKAVLQIEERNTTNGPVMKVKLHNKEKALEIMGRALGFFDSDEAPKDLTEINIHVYDYTEEEK